MAFSADMCSLTEHIHSEKNMKAVISEVHCAGYEPHSALPTALPMVFCEHSPIVPPALKSVKTLATSAVRMLAGPSCVFTPACVPTCQDQSWMQRLVRGLDMQQKCAGLPGEMSEALELVKNSIV
jgi:hypothetical protein